jgi:hypothetical protein
MRKRLDYYTKFKLGIMPISLAAFLFYAITDPWEILFSDWFIDLIAIPGFFGSAISGAGYLGRTGDAMDDQSNMGMWERIGTCVGVGLVLAIGIIFSAIKEALPITTGTEVFGAIGLVNSASGLGNRLGQIRDPGGRPKSEKRAMGIAAILGLAAGIMAYLVIGAAAVTVAGVSTFLTCGAAPILAGVIFATTFSSTCVSAADYASKAASYLDSAHSHDPVVRNTVRERHNEYRNSFWGFSTGVAIAGCILLVLALTQPYVLAGAAGLMVAAMIVICCVSIFAGLCSRMGRLKDVYEKRKKMLAEIPVLPANEAKNDNVSALRLRSSPLNIATALTNARPNPRPRLSTLVVPPVSPAISVKRDQHSAQVLRRPHQLSVLNSCHMEAKSNMRFSMPDPINSPGSMLNYAVSV